MTLDSRTATPVDDFAAALDWWREAGVDLAFADEPSGWLDTGATPATESAPPPPPAPAPIKRNAIERAIERGGDGPRIGGAPEEWPQTLEDFRNWWLTEPSLADAGVAGRLPPRGVAGAKLMLLVPHPARDDAGELLAGSGGRLVAAISRAIGLPPEEAYLASALPAVPALPDWEDLSQRGLGSVLRHHVALARPHRVLVFGRAMAPLFGIDPAATRDPASIALPDGSAVPLLLAPDLAELARSPVRRRNFWTRWLEWTA